jgi:pimeloyl-ACP methyl ester carboxylesterase
MSDPAEVVPRSRSFLSQRLRLHAVDWGNEAAPPLVLVHGGRDHARSFDDVARALCGSWHVVVPDLRGHGDSEWAVGGSYAMAELVLDLDALVDELGPSPVALVGHSLGGAVVLHYAGLRPERVRKLVAIEGLGASPAMRGEMLAQTAAQRLDRYIGAVRASDARTPRRYASLADAATRMREQHAFLTEDKALHLARHGARRSEDGTWVWKYDPYILTPSAARPDFEGLESLWARIACPVLLVRGETSWASDPVLDGRAAAFRDARLANVAGAGHWVHHERLGAFLAAVAAFLAE